MTQHRGASYALVKSLKPWLLCTLVFCTIIAGSEANAENFLSRWDQTLFDRIYDAPPHQQPTWTMMEGDNRIRALSSSYGAFCSPHGLR